MTKLQQAKIDVRKELERDPKRGGACWCEGQKFKVHVCKGPRETNEVLVTKRPVQKLSNKKKAYIYHVINCSLVCQYFHQRWGHSRAFREWFEGYVRDIYGDARVDKWIENLPLKIRVV